MPISLATLTVDPATGIAEVLVNRPEVLNAIDVPTARAIRDAVLLLAGDARVRCVVLRGAGRAFIAGGDLSSFAADFAGAADVVNDLLNALHPAIETLRAIDAPVIAAVHGAAAGAGLSLMGAADLVIAAEGTRFLVAYDRIGAPPDCGGTYFLPRLMGHRRAAQFVFLSETLDAPAALAVGLVNRVVPAAELDAVVLDTALRIARGPTKAYGAYKRLADTAHEHTLPAQLVRERDAFAAATHTADFREGVTAFLVKRPATFTGA